MSIPLELMNSPLWLREWREKMHEKASRFPVGKLIYGLGIESLIPGAAHISMISAADQEEFSFKENESDIRYALEAAEPYFTNRYFAENAASFTKASITVVREGRDEGAIEISAAPLHIVIAEKNSKIHIIDTSGATARTIIILAKEHSRVSFDYYPAFHNEAVAFANKIGIIEKGAALEWREAISGGRFVKSDTVSSLRGERARTEIKSIAVSGGAEQFDIYNRAIHEKKLTESRIISAGAAFGKSKILYRSSIAMKKGITEADGAQKGRFIISSPEAEIDAIPALDIGSPDVRCSHAVSVSHIGEEELFYPSLRGIPETDARKMILSAIFGDFLPIGNAISEKINEYI
ncbi:SufD family Fe-S cluster assembly protein [bacterium]|nr:SufD family Fe-S cluster assembly protein [bacterium]